MSTPSSQNDGQTGGDEYFRQGINHNLSSQHLQQQHQTFVNNNVVLQQQQPLPAANVTLSTQYHQTQPAVATSAGATTTQFVQWPNPLLGGAPFLHQQAQPAPPQQQFNDFLFNIQAQAAYAAANATTVQPTPVPPPSNQPETYSVLRVGNGNFLKIYHCPENAMGPMPGETSFTPMPQYSPSQPTAFPHINPQAAGTQTAQQQQQPSQSPMSAAPNTGSTQVFNSYELFSSNTFTQLPSAEMPPILLLGPNTKTMTFKGEELNTEPQTNMETNNMLIHNLPNNWSGGGNVSAPLYAQFENANKHHDIEPHPINTEGMSLPVNKDTLVNNPSIEETINAHIAIQQQQQNPSMKLHIKEANVIQTSSSSSSSISPTVPITTLTKTEIPRHQESVPRKRIVAEVKPMRMTYSDVLSKFNNQIQNSQQQQNQNNLINSTTITNQRNKQKSSKSDNQNGNNSSNSLNPLSQRRILEEQQVRSSKKSPTHDNKENQQQQMINNNKLNNNPKRSSATVITNNNSTNTLNSNNNNSTLNKPSTTSSQKNLTNNSKTNNNNGCDNQQQKKLRLNKNADIQNIGPKNGNDQQRGSSKNNSNNTSNNSTLSSNAYNSANNTYSRKPTKSMNSGNPTYSATSSASSATNQQRSRYQNNSNASYSYLSTRRGRNNSSYGTSSSLNNAAYVNGTGRNRNYELAKRFLQAWYTYTIKILTWLFYLVYDIVVLGCSILYERLTYAYDCSKTYLKQLHRDVKQNSNKPGIWFKNYCRKFDAKFSKTSKWAFWRRFYKKKPPESSSESIKTGRLPATGDEAMYQLLNCKGKDAYSILGVPPNSSQEQIRKHYKKIAVLVHPDKNKQPGAEEAFKVLQRAFELIGEPENRLAYDQSLAEALHAEKAWTELHDLLSQLQTKITEAANTIRCSTCGLRHPRKITDRPYYAARECASCKIRHSAREGDIWAETSMLGLRWKYLALMEGKVYDITEWANCQKGALAHLEPNSHMVQYRIVRGAQQQQQHQQQQQQQKQQAHQHQQQQQQQQHTGSQYPSSGVGGTFNRDNIPPRCSTCGLRHPRKITDRPYYAARECASCKIRHSAREGDIWAETSMLGLRWKYLALMEGKVYDITEWANCQKGALAHLEPNSHMVQYRIVRGAQQQQQHQQQQQQQKQQAHQHQQQQQQQQHTGSQYPSSGVGGTFNRDNIPPSEASLHEFLDNLYSRQHPQQQQNSSAYAGSSRRRNRRN